MTKRKDKKAYIDNHTTMNCMQNYTTLEQRASWLENVIGSCLVGKRLFEFDQRLGIFVFNFGDGIEYSLHVECFLRVTQGNTILLTSNDQFYSPNWEPLSKREYKKEQNMPRGRSLLSVSAERLRHVTNHSVVQAVKIEDLGDLSILFDNGVRIEICLDRMEQNNEFYRFFKYRSDPHYVVKYLDGKVVLETVGEQ